MVLLPQELVSMPGFRESGFPMSNERYFTNLAPVVAHVSGAVIAVGSDQGLHMLAMAPHTTEGHFIDLAPQVRLARLAYLETMSRLNQLNGGSAASPDQLRAIFRNSKLTVDLLHADYIGHYMFSDEELQETQAFVEKYKIDQYIAHLAARPGTWAQHIGRITGLYDSGNIHMYTGDIVSGPVIDHVASSLQDRGVSAGVLYTSNANVKMGEFQSMLDRLPTTLDTRLVVATTRWSSYLRYPPYDLSYNGPQVDWLYLVADPAGVTSLFPRRDDTDPHYAEIAPGVYQAE